MLPTTYPKWAKDTYKLNVRGWKKKNFRQMEMTGK